jgi:hypothetical protein
MNSLTQNTTESLLQEIKATLIEYEFTSRWALVEGYHKVGELIANNEKSVSLTQIAEYTSKSKRTIYRCLQFYKKYPDLQLLPEGKDTSWNRVVTKYLPETIKEKEPELFECPKCHFKFGRGDMHD